ncbi:MAG: acyltransferase [Nitrospiraceae bacterium]
MTVTSGVQFITHDGGIAVIRKHLGHASIFGPIVVGNNVFIGYGSILLPNIRIGDNVLIAAGAVVTRDLPSGVVAAGVPARPIKTVEEYAKTVSAHAVLIEHLSPDQKRQFLLERYRPTQSAPAGREERR